MLRFQGIYDREDRVGVQSGGLTLEHGCYKKNVILVQNKLNKCILTPKEKRELHNKKYMLQKKNVEEDVEKERQRKIRFYKKDNNAEKIKRNSKQLYKNSPEPKKQKMNKYYADEQQKEKQRDTINTYYADEQQKEKQRDRMKEHYSEPKNMGK